MINTHWFQYHVLLLMEIWVGTTSLGSQKQMSAQQITKENVQIWCLQQSHMLLVLHGRRVMGSAMLSTPQAK